MEHHGGKRTGDPPLLRGSACRYLYQPVVLFGVLAIKA